MNDMYLTDLFGGVLQHVDENTSFAEEFLLRVAQEEGEEVEEKGYLGRMGSWLYEAGQNTVWAFKDLFGVNLRELEERIAELLIRKGVLQERLRDEFIGYLHNLVYTGFDAMGQEIAEYEKQVAQGKSKQEAMQNVQQKEQQTAQQATKVMQTVQKQQDTQVSSGGKDDVQKNQLDSIYGDGQKALTILKQQGYPEKTIHWHEVRLNRAYMSNNIEELKRVVDNIGTVASNPYSPQAAEEVKKLQQQPVEQYDVNEAENPINVYSSENMYNSINKYAYLLPATIGYVAEFEDGSNQDNVVLLHKAIQYVDNIYRYGGTFSSIGSKLKEFIGNLSPEVKEKAVNDSKVFLEGTGKALLERYLISKGIPPGVGSKIVDVLMDLLPSSISGSSDKSVDMAIVEDGSWNTDKFSGVYDKVNSHTFFLQREGSYYKDLENILYRYAVDKQIDNVESVDIVLTKDGGSTLFRRKEAFLGKMLVSALGNYFTGAGGWTAILQGLASGYTESWLGTFLGIGGRMLGGKEYGDTASVVGQLVGILGTKLLDKYFSGDKEQIIQAVEKSKEITASWSNVEQAIKQAIKNMGFPEVVATAFTLKVSEYAHKQLAGGGSISQVTLDADKSKEDDSSVAEQSTSDTTSTTVGARFNESIDKYANFFNLDW